MRGVRAEDFDPIDEQRVEVHDGHAVEMIVSVRLDPAESRLLTELAEAEGADLPDTMRAAIHHYAAASSQRASR